MSKYLKPLRGIQLNKTHPRARGLVGRWVFNQNSGLILPDYSGFENQGTISGATWTPGDRGPTLQFDGIDDVINCGNKSILNFGTGNFTIIARVKTATTLTDVIGDIVSKFDAANKKGFNLTILHNAGSAGSQSNFRQVVFGIDNNHPDIAWVEKAPTLGAETYIFSLAVYNGKLYGGTAPNGKLYEWNGTNAWVEKAPTLGAETEIRSLAIYNGNLYGGTAPNGKLYEWNGTNAWVEKAPKLGAETEIRSLAVYNGKLYGGTIPNGKLYEWNGTNAWVEKAPTLGAEIYIQSLAVYNGKLYGGTIPNGKLYEWNGTNAWVEKAPTLGAETQIRSLAVYNGKLYGGTIPNGKLYEWNTGRVVSYDYELGSSWKDIAAVRDTNALKLYIDGVLVNTSTIFTASDYDLSNAVDLLIGFGQQDYFNGNIDDISIYNRALSADEIRTINEKAYSEFEYMDGWLPGSTVEKTTTFTLDAYVAERKTATFTLDAYVASKATFTLDAYIASKATFTLNAYIAERKTATCTLDAYVASKATITIDAEIQGEGIRFLYQVIEEQIPGIYTIALSKTTAGPPISKAIWIPPSNIQFYLALSYDGTNFSQDIEIMPHTPYRLSGVARAVRITIP